MGIPWRKAGTLRDVQIETGCHHGPGTCENGAADRRNRNAHCERHQQLRRMELMYKTLFEIKLMHEYFLTKEDGSNLFSEPDPQKRLDLLGQAFDNRAAMDSDIAFDFPEALKSSFQGYGLKILPSYGGCKVLIRVNKIILTDNSVVFEPFFSIPDLMEIFIVFIKKNNLPDIYSNERIARSIPSLYFFSNENIP